MKTKEIINKFKIKQTLINMSIDEMKSTLVDSSNFFDCTVANWEEIDIDIEFIPNYKSASGSEYMYTDKGIYRKSNHWNCQVLTCVWLLNNECSNKETTAFCSYDNFKKYSSKRDKSNRRDNSYIVLQDNIYNMLNGAMVLKHRIGSIIN